MKNVLFLFVLLTAVPAVCQNLKTLPVSKYKTGQVFYKNVDLNNRYPCSLLFTPDSKEILLHFCQENQLDIMDPATGAITSSVQLPQKVQFMSKPLNDHVIGFLFSERGNGNGSEAAYVYDFKTGICTDTIALPQSTVGFVFLEKGKKLLLQSGNDLFMLDRTTGISTPVIQENRFDPATRMVVSADEKWLFMMNDFRFQVWKMDQAPARKVLDKSTVADYCMAEMSPDGRYVSWYESAGTLYLYDMSTGKIFTRPGVFSGLNYMPDGKQLVVVSGGNNNIEVLQLPELTTIRKIPAPVKPLGFKMSPNGRSAVAYDASSAQLWNVGTILDNELAANMPPLREDTKTITFLPQPGPADSLPLELYRRGNVDEWQIAYAKNGKRVAIPTYFDYTGMPRSTEIWDLPSGKMQMTISGSAAALALDPEGTLMAYGPYDSTVYLLDLKQRKILFSIKTTDPEIRKMQFSDDGKKLAIAFGDPTRFMVVDVQTGKILQKITTDLSSAIFIWFSENAAVVSVGDNNEHLETWNWQDSLKTRQVRLTENGSMPFFSPNHKLLFYYKNDKIVEIRDFEKGKTIGQVNRPNLYAQAFFSADNSMLYFIEHLSLFRYHIATGKRDTVQIPDFKMRYSTYGSQWSFAPYSNYLINTEFMRIWNLGKGVALPTTPRHDTPTMSSGLRIHTCFSADGIKMYSVKDPLGSTTVEVITWNTITQQPVSSIRVPDFTNKDLVLSPDDRYFAVVPHNMASDSIRIWDILLKKTILSLPFKGEYRVVFSPDSRYLYTCDGYGQMSCFTLPKGEKASLPDAPSFYRINDLLFSADHKHLLTVNTTGVLTLLQYPSLKPLTTMQANIKEGAFISTAVSADGTLVAGLPGGNEIDIWDGITGQLLHTLKDTAAVFFSGPVFSPDNKYLYVAGTDEAVHVFDLKTGVFAYCIPQGFSVSGMEFIRNQPNILTVTGQGQVRFWDIQK